MFTNSQYKECFKEIAKKRKKKSTDQNLMIGLSYLMLFQSRVNSDIFS